MRRCILEEVSSTRLCLPFRLLPLDLAESSLRPHFDNSSLPFQLPFYTSQHLFILHLNFILFPPNMRISIPLIVGISLLAGCAAASVPNIEIKVCDCFAPYYVGSLNILVSNIGILSFIGLEVLLFQQRHSIVSSADSEFLTLCSCTFHQLHSRHCLSG